MLNKIIKFKESDTTDEGLFERIALDIQDKGYSINPNALPFSLGDELLRHVNKLSDDKFSKDKLSEHNLSEDKISEYKLSRE